MSTPMQFALVVEHWIFYLLTIAAFVVELWALADVARRPADAFLRAGQRTKSFWLLLTGVAAVVGLLGVLTGGGGFGIFAMAALCVASVYLAGPGAALRLHGGR